jgi:hypothetical protein
VGESQISFSISLVWQGSRRGLVAGDCSTRAHAWGQRFFFEFCFFFGFSCLWRAGCDFSFLIDGMVETERILMGVFFWGCQLVRSYSPKSSSRQLAYPKDAGKFLSSIPREFVLTIKSASSNSPHKKMRSGRFVNYPKPPCWAVLSSSVR